MSMGWDLHHTSRRHGCSSVPALGCSCSAKDAMTHRPRAACTHLPQERLEGVIVGAVGAVATTFVNRMERRHRVQFVLGGIRWGELPVRTRGCCMRGRARQVGVKPLLVRVGFAAPVCGQGSVRAGRRAPSTTAPSDCTTAPGVCSTAPGVGAGNHSGAPTAAERN